MKCEAKTQDFFSKSVLMSTTWLDDVEIKSLDANETCRMVIAIVSFDQSDCTLAYGKVLFPYSLTLAPSLL